MIASIPIEILALIIEHLSILDPNAALKMPLICRKLQAACQNAAVRFDLYSIGMRRSTATVTMIHRWIASQFPRVRRLVTSMATDIKPLATESVESMASVLRSCRKLKHLAIHMDHGDRSTDHENRIEWQSVLTSALTSSNQKLCLSHLELGLDTRPGSEIETATLLAAVGPSLKSLLASTLWMDQDGLAVVSSKMRKLTTLCLDSSLLMLDMPNPDSPEALMGDVLSAARYHWKHAQLDKDRLIEFIEVWTPDFWYNGCRILEWAIQSENVRFVQVLLEHGASPHIASDGSPTTPLISAVKTRNVEMARLLLEHGASPDESTSFSERRPLHVAVRNVDHPMIRLLFEYDVDPHCVDDFGMSAMAIAATNGFLAVMGLLHVLGVPSTNMLPGTVQPIDAACAANQASSVAHLIRRGASLVHADTNRPCPVFESVRNGRLAVLEALLFGGASPNVRYENMTALCNAIMRCDIAIVMRLVVSESNTNEPSLECRRTGVMSSPLHHAVNVGSFQIAEFLLDHSADINALAGDGTTPLYRAVRTRNTALAGLLLERGADITNGNILTGESALVGVV